MSTGPSCFQHCCLARSTSAAAAAGRLSAPRLSGYPSLTRRSPHGNWRSTQGLPLVERSGGGDRRIGPALRGNRLGRYYSPSFALIGRPLACGARGRGNHRRCRHRHPPAPPRSFNAEPTGLLWWFIAVDVPLMIVSLPVLSWLLLT